MRILLVNASNIWGGGEYYTLSLASALKKTNHLVTIACCINSKLLEKTKQNSIDHVLLPAKLSGINNQVKALKILSKFIRYNQIQIIHTNTSHDRTIGAFASKLCGIKHISSCHSLESISHNLTHIVRNRITDSFIADGVSVYNLLIRKDKIPAHKIHVIHNGIDPSEHKRNPELRKRIRNSLSLNKDEVLIGNVSRLVPFKGQRYLLEAFRILTRKYENVRLLIAGSGELAHELNEKCRELEIDNKVIFTGHTEKLNEIYNVIDIYVQPSLSEGGELFPYTVLYAMAQAIPIIVTKSGDMPYMIEDGVNGYVVKDKSPDEISEKLEILLLDRTKRNLFGSVSYQRLIENFSFEKMYYKTVSVYEKLLSDSARNQI